MSMRAGDSIQNEQIECAVRREGDDGPGRFVAGQWAAFVAAVQFLTRVPLSPATPISVNSLRTAPLYFPVVGALIGTFTAFIAGAGCLVWPAWLAVLAALAAEARLTGALHEDAVADFCDAFGGGRTRDEVLTILKDSRIGAYGALGLFLAVALRAAATVAVIEQRGLADWPAWGSAIVASSAIGRWMMVVAMACLAPVAGRESLTNDVGGRVSARQVIISGLGAGPAAILFVWLTPIQALVAFALLAAAVSWLLRSIRRRLGGLTGDCLGCIGYVAQVLVLLAAAARLGSVQVIP
jgi:adenosylcobinamide-GDP ribazoletransferase